MDLMALQGAWATTTAGGWGFLPPNPIGVPRGAPVVGLGAGAGGRGSGESAKKQAHSEGPEARRGLLVRVFLRVRLRGLGRSARCCELRGSDASGCPAFGNPALPTAKHPGAI